MWAYNETFYQIYPIGFCGAPVHNDGRDGAPDLKVGRMGGISAGTRDRIHYPEPDL